MLNKILGDLKVYEFKYPDGELRKIIEKLKYAIEDIEKENKEFEYQIKHLEENIDYFYNKTLSYTKKKNIKIPEKDLKSFENLYMVCKEFK
jgi:Zn-finger nucleic acid-binding protein